jgi:spermidine synthase
VLLALVSSVGAVRRVLDLGTGDGRLLAAVLAELALLAGRAT